MIREYSEVANEVETITDNLNLPIDQGIKKIVIALRLWSFPTSGSCEGHLSRGESYPWVEIYAPEQKENDWKKANMYERKRLTELIDKYYETKRIKPIFEFENIGIFGGFRLVNKNMLKRKTLTKADIARYQKNFDDFADYLISVRL